MLQSMFIKLQKQDLLLRAETLVFFYLTAAGLTSSKYATSYKWLSSFNELFTEMDYIHFQFLSVDLPCARLFCPAFVSAHCQFVIYFPQNSLFISLYTINSLPTEKTAPIGSYVTKTACNYITLPEVCKEKLTDCCTCSTRRYNLSCSKTHQFA
jgi:hypothetical protein